MADNINKATDDINGVHHPYTKIEFGPDGTATKVDADNPFPIEEKKAAKAEDNTAGVFAHIHKSVNSDKYSPLNYQMPSTPVTKASIRSTRGNVYAFRVSNANTAARFFQLHNKTSAPVANDTAYRKWKIPGGNADNPGVLQLDINYLAPSVDMFTGIAWAISTTRDTFTDAATASEHDVDINYA